MRLAPARTTIPRPTYHGSRQGPLRASALVALAAALYVLATAPLAIAGEAPTTAGDPGASQDKPVVPPGQEELLADAFGKGVELPGQCRFSGGNINGATIVLTYDCANGRLELNATHPTLAEQAVVKSEKFALRVTAGTAAEGFLDALAARIREHEEPFQWALPKPKVAADSGHRSGILALAGTAAVGAVWLAFRVRQG